MTVLHHLLTYAKKRNLVAQPGFSEREIKWMIAFDAQSANP
jgi:hypothetical protein